MKFTRLITLFCSLLVWGGLVRAQEPATAAWLVSNFDVTANLNAEARSVGLRAALSVRNVGRGNGATLTVRLAQKAEVKFGHQPSRCRRFLRPHQPATD